MLELSTETYLQKHFYASERLEAARLRASASPEDAIAQNFVRRVQPSPKGGPSGRHLGSICPYSGGRFLQILFRD